MEQKIEQYGEALPSRSPFVNLVFHRQIRESRLPFYAALLELSVAQKNALRKKFREYVEVDTQYRLEHTAPLWERSADVAANPPSSYEYSSGFGELMKERDKANAQIEVIEQRFFEGLIPFLTDEQQENLPRVIHMRIRERARFTHIKFPGSELDLTEQLLTMQFNGYDIEGSQPGSRITELVIEYEQAVTPLFHTAAQRRIARMIDGSALASHYDQLVAAHDDPNECRDELIELYRQRQALGERVYEAERPIHDTNHKYVALLVAALPEESAKRLETWFRENAYPVVYPDPFDLEAVFDAIREAELLDIDQNAAVAQETERYRTERDSIEQRMQESYIEWWKVLAVQKGRAVAFEYPQYQARMQELQSQRHDNARRTLTAIRGLLNEDQLSRLARRLADADEQLEQTRQQYLTPDAPESQWPPPHG